MSGLAAILLMAFGTAVGGSRSAMGPAVGVGTAGADAAVREVFVTVNDARIRAFCVGRDPEVIILHGANTAAQSWRAVLTRLDGSVSTCVYDRRGSGASDPAPAERGWYELLDELRRVHVALGARPGTVLVGQGLGGLYARLYALDRSADVGGLLLVDPDHERMLERIRHAIPPEAWQAREGERVRPNADGIVEGDLAERLRGRRLPDLPVTVLTATVRDGGPDWDMRFVNEAAHRLHAEILQGVPLARHIPAARSGPEIHVRDPRLVADEIGRVVRSRR
jgi:pimeloyl-ACP methyl ester carboxylesterase